MASSADGGARWLAALSLATGTPTPEAQRLFRRRRLTLLFWAAVILAVAVGAGVVLAAWARQGGSSGPSAAPRIASWRPILGAGLFGLGIVVEIVVVIKRTSAGDLGAGWRAPTLVLHRDQQRELTAQLRGRAPIDPLLLPLVRSAAVRISRQRTVLGLWVALPLLFLGIAIQSDRVVGWVLAGSVTVFYVIVALTMARDIRRAEVFLDRHSANGAAAGAGDLPPELKPGGPPPGRTEATERAE